MSRKPIIAGNWKMFKTIEEAVSFVSEVKGQLTSDTVEALIAAPFTVLPALVQATAGTTIGVGAQNLYFEDSGAFTGEISGSMLAEVGVKYVIVGHSERRQYFGETDQIVNKKVLAAFRNGIIPILCVGEKLKEREAGHTNQVVCSQVKENLLGLTTEQVRNLIIAYEPIWAIGTGKSSTAVEANQTISYIRAIVNDNFGNTAAEEMRILYGGSVKPNTVMEYMSQEDIDGALVGGASLDSSSYMALVKGGEKG